MDAGAVRLMVMHEAAIAAEWHGDRQRWAGTALSTASALLRIGQPQLTIAAFELLDQQRRMDGWVRDLALDALPLKGASTTCLRTIIRSRFLI